MDASLKIREELDNLLSAEIGKYTTEDTSLECSVRLREGNGPPKAISIGHFD